MRAPRRNAPLIRFLITALYCLLVISYASPLIVFSSLFLTYLLPYLSLSFPLRIDPLRFQAGGRKRRLNLALVFFVYFVLQYISFDWRMRAFVVSDLVLFRTKPRDWLEEMCLRNDLFCVEWNVKPQLSQSVGMQFTHGRRV